MDDPNNNLQVRQSHIAALLIANREGETDWGEMAQLAGEPCSKKMANAFLLCCLLDYQIDSDLAWRNGGRLIKDILDDPDDLWGAITSVPESEWKAKRDEYKLHRFPAAHTRLWQIARRICDEHGGDARRIWEGKNPREALERLGNLRAGDQISRMVVGALRDCGQITGTTSDVKGDVYVRRVLGRAIWGKEIDSEMAEMAVTLAHQLHPADPWQLDAQLWYIGKNYCRTTPNCSRCYLAPYCAYALERSSGGRSGNLIPDRSTLGGAAPSIGLAALAPNPTIFREIVLEVGTEGGSITLLGERNAGDNWQFQIETDESTLYDLLSEEDRNTIVEYCAQTVCVSSLHEALGLLDRYQWFSLCPLKVHPEFLDAVLLEVRKRGGPSEETRWRKDLKHR
jgi:hypothetical protein